MTYIIIAILIAIISLGIGYFIGVFDVRKKTKESVRISRSVLGGMFSEQLAPYLPDFPFDPIDVKFLGKPVDLIVFKGIDEKNITEVVFVEVKSGKAHLNHNETNLRDVIRDKKVSWYEYRVPEGITKLYTQK